jgi:hypothetical protein
MRGRGPLARNSRRINQQARITVPAGAAGTPRVGSEYCRLNAACLPVGGPESAYLPVGCRSGVGNMSWFQ